MNKTTGVSCKKRSAHIYFMEKGSSYTLSSITCNEHRDQIMRQEVKNKGKIKLSALKRGRERLPVQEVRGHLQRVLTVRFCRENLGVLDWRSLMRGGCTWRFYRNSKLMRNLFTCL